MDLVPTANQPIGPFYHFALTPGWAAGDNSAGVMAGPGALGERIRLTVRVLNGAGSLVTNGMIELWQANAGGKYNHPADTQDRTPDPAFHGFGRLATDDQGLCVFETVKPGQVPGLRRQLQAPHINVSIYAPGLLRRVVTRIYFDGDAANESDEILGLIPEDRRASMLARPGGESGQWCFDLHLTGPCETVFFDISERALFLRPSVRSLRGIGLENRLDGLVEEPGDAEGERQTGVVFAVFNGVDSLTRNLQPRG